MNPVTFRAAREADLASIATIARAAYARYTERMGREPAPMHADFAAQIAQAWVIVAERDLEVLGYAVSYPRDDHVHLENVAVSPSVAGQGIGKALIKEVEARALALGRQAVELYTNEKMTENLLMYPALGYRETGRSCQDGFDRVFYRKTLVVQN